MAAEDATATRAARMSVSSPRNEAVARWCASSLTKCVSGSPDVAAATRSLRAGGNMTRSLAGWWNSTCARVGAGATHPLLRWSRAPCPLGGRQSSGVKEEVLGRGRL